MKQKINVALFIVIVLSCFRVGAAQQASSTGATQARPSSSQTNNVQLVIEGKVVRVSDGDTITVLDADNKQHKIRFEGIDAPESKQEFGQVSKANLSKLVFGKQVTVLWSKVDKYRRTVGKVMLDGVDINLEQVKGGFAWHYKKYAGEQPPEDQVSYAAAENEARAAKRGLWANPNPTPPGEWRADAKTERWGPAPPEGTIIGNKSSKKYHRPDCPGYRDMAERNRVFFKTVAEAEAAGYQRAGNCQPETAASTAATPAARATKVAATTQEKPQTDKTEKPAPAKTTTTPTAEKTAGAATEEVVGNKNSKIYHLPGCPGYTKVSEKNRVVFKSAEEAETAGYKKAGNCKAEGSAAGATPTVKTETKTPETPPTKETPGAASMVTDGTTTPSTPTGGEVIGNKNSKIYHRPDCPGYKSVSEKNQVKFKTVAEAEAAGYRAAKNCPAQ